MLKLLRHLTHLQFYALKIQDVGAKCFCLIFLSHGIVEKYHTIAVFVSKYNTSANVILILYNISV